MSLWTFILPFVAGVMAISAFILFILGTGALAIRTAPPDARESDAVGRFVVGLTVWLVIGLCWAIGQGVLFALGAKP